MIPGRPEIRQQPILRSSFGFFSDIFVHLLFYADIFIKKCHVTLYEIYE